MSHNICLSCGNSYNGNKCSCFNRPEVGSVEFGYNYLRICKKDGWLYKYASDLWFNFWFLKWEYKKFFFVLKIRQAMDFILRRNNVGIIN